MCVRALRAQTFNGDKEALAAINQRIMRENRDARGVAQGHVSNVVRVSFFVRINVVTSNRLETVSLIHIEGSGV